MVGRGIVVGTSLSKYLLEKSRVVFQVRVLIKVCCYFSKRYNFDQIETVTVAMGQCVNHSGPDLNILIIVMTAQRKNSNDTRDTFSPVPEVNFPRFPEKES